MNHLYPNFFITHEREGRWHELQPGRDISKCLSGTCSRHCLLAAGRDQHSTTGDGTSPYCAWLVPLPGEPLGHFQMVEGGKGEIGRVYNPYVIRSHLPSAQLDHPLARAFPPAKHALLTEFYRRGHKASHHYAKDDEWEDELGRTEQDQAMRIALAYPEWLEVFCAIAKDFLWSFEAVASITPPRSVVQVIPAIWLDISQGIGGHNGEYDWKCQACGYTTWFARYTDPNKEKIECLNCEKLEP